jgi:hypothetical protein
MIERVMRRFRLCQSAIWIIVIGSYLSAVVVDCDPPMAMQGDHHESASHGHGLEAMHVGDEDSPGEAARQDVIHAASKDAVLKATCSCGCAKTRARVGGNASRLGAAVPARFVASLLAAERSEGTPPGETLAPQSFSDREPVPI